MITNYGRVTETLSDTREYYSKIQARLATVSGMMYHRDDVPEPKTFASNIADVTTFLINLEGTMYAGKGNAMPWQMQKCFAQVFKLLDSLCYGGQMLTSQQEITGTIQLFPFGVHSYHIVTGRPQSYVEGFSVASHARFYGPHIFERGARIGAFGTEGKWHWIENLAKPGDEWIRDLIEHLETTFPNLDIRALIEEGKSCTLTINTPSEKDPQQFAGSLGEHIKSYVTSAPNHQSAKLNLHYTQTGVDICPAHVSKERGVDTMLSMIGRSWGDCVVIADCVDDIDLLEKAAVACISEQTSHGDVADFIQESRHEQSKYVSELPHGWGTLDSMLRVVEHKIALRQQAGPERVPDMLSGVYERPNGGDKE